jgi:hypothetical protein
MSMDHGIGSYPGSGMDRGGFVPNRHVDPRDAGPARTAQYDDVSFWDMLDVINPLQHIPLLSILYRELTGDTIHPTARVLGGALYGGPVGMVAGVVNSVVEQETGDDIAGNALAAIRGDSASEADGELAAGPDGSAEAPPPAADRPPAAAAAAQAAGAQDPAAGPDLALAPAPGGSATPAAPAGGAVEIGSGADAALAALAGATPPASVARATESAAAAAAYRAHDPAARPAPQVSALAEPAAGARHYAMQDSWQDQVRG